MARLIEEHIDALWGRGEHATLHGWLDRLPAELVSSRPHLCILKAWYLFASGQLDAAEQLLRAAADTERSPTEREPASDLDRDKIRGRIATIRAFLAFYRGDVERIAEYARRALEHLPEQDLVWRSTATVVLGDAYGLSGQLEAALPVRREALAASKAVGNVYMILIASLKLAATLRQQGWLEQAIEVCRQHVQYAQEIGMSHAADVGCLLAIWGEALAELGDLDEALERAQRGVELAERGTDVIIIGWSYVCLVRVLVIRGDLPAAQEICRRAEEVD
jgi:ATP/maltotriose-dependent transcriptional regulator MalT